MFAGLIILAIGIVAKPAPAFAVAPPVPAGLQKGDAFTFVGTVAEEVKRPGKEFRRGHDLELRVFVLERTDAWADVAMMTRLRRTEDAVTGVAGTVTGAGARKESPPSLRLDVIRVHADGTVHSLAPLGPPPLRLNAETQSRAMPLLPLDGIASSEFGVFPPRPPRDAAGEPWAVAVGPNRPDETWQAKGYEFFNAERCQCLVVNQQSADWLKPVGGVAAWHRAESVWVSTQDGTARKVHRVIRQRDGRVDSPPAAWIEVKYALKDQAKLTGRTFDEARLDFETAYVALAEASLPLGPKAFDTRLGKLDAYLKDADPVGIYRDALAAARRALEAAKRGESAAMPANPVLEPIAAPAAPPVRWPEPGAMAPDLHTDGFRLANAKGKPVVLVFLKPGGAMTDLTIAVADALEKRYSGKVIVAPFVVSGELAAVLKDRDRLKFSVPLFEGSAAAAAYGVETVPRFAVIDAAGKVRWTFSGIGAETGFLVREQLDGLVPPTPPNAPPVRTAFPGPLPVPLVPPP